MSFWQLAMLTTRAEAIRYLAITAIFALIAWGIGRLPRWRRPIQSRPVEGRQLRREALLSIASIVIFGQIFPLLLALGLEPHLRFYRDIGEYGWGYFFLSIVLMMAIQDTWFYWTHRLMHHRRLFRIFHRTHHLSTNPGPLTTYAIHPLEAIVDSGANVLVLFVLPAHFLALFIFSWLNIAWAVYGHLGYELFPRGMAGHWLGRWINTSVAHNIHHERARYHYGWYTLVWDRLCGTMDPEYEARYRRGFAEPA